MIDPLARFEPTAADPFDLRKVGHLLRRAGFGAGLVVRRRLARRGLDAALHHVAPALETAPAADALLQEVIAYGEIERVRAFRVWLAVQSAHPLRERMSMFWHGHFATSNQKLRDPRAMALQMATFDRLGLGRCDDLVLAMCRDPALLRWLDNEVNTKAQPNENFARELFELFTLGRGNYDERDIREAARAFSGWHVRDGRFYFSRRLHDDGDKEVFGQRGAFDGADIAGLAVGRAESARFFAERWLRFFVHPRPEPGEVAALARVYEHNGRHVGKTIMTLLQSRLFFSPRAWRSKVKSPADFVIGTVRALGGRAQPTWLARVMASLGETWLEPPSVEGWHGERAWLSPASWLLRSNFVADLVAHRRGDLQPGAERLLRGLHSVEHRVRAVEQMLLDGAVSAAGHERLVAVASQSDDARELLHATACLPEYQLS